MSGRVGPPGPPGPPGVGTPGAAGPAGPAPTYAALIALSAPDYGYACQSDAGGVIDSTYGALDLTATNLDLQVATNPLYPGAKSIKPSAGTPASGDGAVSGALSGALVGVHFEGWSLEGWVYLPRTGLNKAIILGVSKQTSQYQGGLLWVGQENYGTTNADKTWAGWQKAGINNYYGFTGVGSLADSSTAMAFASNISVVGWHHVALAFPGQNGDSYPNFYIDGQLMPPSDGSSDTNHVAFNSNSKISILHDNAASPSAPAGGIQVCHCYAYARQLTGGEVLARVNLVSLLNAIG
jgi:hypothetical protein